MTRQTALEILTKYLSNKTLLRHSFAVEAVMRSLAPIFKDNPDVWGIAGLLHDADYEQAKGNPQLHGKLLFQLEPNVVPSIIEHAIKAHNFDDTRIAPESPMDWTLYCCDELTGIIAEIAQNSKAEKLADVTTEMVINKINDKNFAKDAPKDHIFLCESKLGIPVQEFIERCLKAMQQVHEELGM